MRVLLSLVLVLTWSVVGCGSDDGSSGPGSNQPPYFSEPPDAQAPQSLLLSLVVGDQVGYAARAVDPDVEPVTYLWELVREEDGEYVPAPEAGTVTGAQTSQAVWTAGDFEGSVRMRCTISDGKDETSSLTRSYSMGTALNELDVTSNLTLGVADSPYVVIGGLNVQPSFTLTLDAGVELQIRPQRAGAVWLKQEIRVQGVLEATGTLNDPVVILGGYSRDPEEGGGSAQLKGIVAADGGRVSLTYTRVQDAEAGLRILSFENSEASFCNFTSCDTGVRVERGSGTLLRNVLFRDNSTGLQVNSAGVTLEDCDFISCATYGINLDASTNDASLLVTGGDFQSNSQAHVRLASLSGGLISATIRGANLLEQANDSPSINLFADCSSYTTLELRGNYWGRSVMPGEIVEMFAGDRTCSAGVLDWTDSDCGGNPEDCDWSNVAWN